MLSSRQLRGAICLLWLILWRVLISRKQFEPFLVAAVVGVRRVRSVRSDRTPQTPRTVRTARTVRLFGGLKSDFRAVFSGLGFAFQQVGRLERIARKAENSGQFSAAVGAITALNRMMALGADQNGFRGHRTHPRRY